MNKSVVDEKVVSMKFDNAKFEKNVKTSMSTLDKLKEKLRFKDTKEDIEDLNKAAKQVDLSPIEKNANNVLENISIRSLAKFKLISGVIDDLIAKAKQIATEITVAPVKSGFAEYEQKMGSVQTIMNGANASLEDTMEALEKLNEYADRTIYSFQDMTSNIGKFTNAGVNLQDSVDAIRGVSNVAALAGANAAEASRAMYNLAQSLSAGYVKLIDWKSIENANMATVQFKEELLKSAAALGTVKKQANGTYKTLKGNVVSATRGFNDTLQEQWLTSEALINALKNYADETTEIGKKAYSAAQDVKTITMLFDTLKESIQSGWATTWELFIGDFEEAKETLSGISKVLDKFVGSISDARNYMLKGALNGTAKNWKTLKNAIKNAGIPVEEFEQRMANLAIANNESLRDIISSYKTIEDSFEAGWANENTFAETFNSYLDEMNNGTRKFTDKQKQALIDITEEANKVGSVYSNLASSLSRAGQQSGRELLLKSLLELGLGVVRILKSIGNAWNKVFGLGTSSGLYNLIAGFENFTSKLVLSEKSMEKLERVFNGVFSVVKLLSDGIKFLAKLAGAVFVTIFGEAGDTVLDVLAKFGDFIARTIDMIRNSEVLQTVLKSLIVIVARLSFALRSVFRSVTGKLSITGIIEAIGKGLLIIYNLLSKGFSKAASFISDGLIKGLLNGQNGPIAVIKSLANKMIDVFKKIFGIASPAKKMIEFGKYICLGLFEGLKSGAKWVINGITSLANTVLSFFNKKLNTSTIFKKVTTGIKNFAINLFSTIINAVGSAYAWIQSNWSTIMKWLERAFALVMSVVYAKIIVKINKTVNKVVDIFSGVVKAIIGIANSLADTIASVGLAFSKYLKAVSLKQTAIALLIFAVSLTVFTKALITLANMPYDQLVTGAKRIGIFVAAMLALMTVLNILNRLTAIKSNSGGVAKGFAGFFTSLKDAFTSSTASASALVKFIGISAIILGLAFMLKEIASVFKLINIDPDIEKKLGIFALIILTLSAMVGYITALAFLVDGKTMLAGALTLLISVISLAIVVKNIGGWLESLYSTYDIIQNNLEKTAIIFGALVGLLATVALTTRLIGQNIAKIGINFLLIALGLSAIGKMVIKLSASSTWEGLGKAGALIAGTLGMFSLTLLAASKAGEHSAKAIKSLKSLALAITLIAGTTVILGLPLIRTLAERGIGTVGAISAMIAAMLIASSKAKDVQFKTFMGMAVAAALLGGTAVLLGTIPTNVVKKGTIVLGAITAMIDTMLLSSKNNQSIVKNIVAFTGSLLVIFGSLYLLTRYTEDADKMIKVAFAMAIVMGALTIGIVGLSVLANALNSVDPKTLASKLMSFVVTLGAIAIIAGALSFILALSSNVINDADNFVGLCEGLVQAMSVLVLLASVIAVVTHYIKDIHKNMVSIGVLLGVVFTLGLMMAALGIALMPIVDIPWNKLLANAGVLVGTLTILIGIAIGIISLGSVLTKAAAAGTVGIALLVGIVGAMVLGLRFLAEVMNEIAEYDWRHIADQFVYAISALSSLLIMVAILTAASIALGTILSNVGTLALFAFGMVAVIAVIETLISIANRAAGPLTKMSNASSVMADALMKSIEALTLLDKFLEHSIDDVKKFITNSSNIIESMHDAGLKVGNSFIDGLANGIRNGAFVIIAAMGSLFDSMNNELDVRTKEFARAIGASLLMNSSPVIEAGYALGNGMMDAIKLPAKINSPSKEAEDIGMYVNRGLAIGLAANVTAPVSAAYALGSALISALRIGAGVNSPSIYGVEVGEMIGKGVQEGEEGKGTEYAVNGAEYMMAETIYTLDTVSKNFEAAVPGDDEDFDPVAEAKKAAREAKKAREAKEAMDQLFGDPIDLSSSFDLRDAKNNLVTSIPKEEAEKGLKEGKYIIAPNGLPNGFVVYTKEDYEKLKGKTIEEMEAEKKKYVDIIHDASPSGVISSSKPEKEKSELEQMFDKLKGWIDGLSGKFDIDSITAGLGDLKSLLTGGFKLDLGIDTESINNFLNSAFGSGDGNKESIDDVLSNFKNLATDWKTEWLGSDSESSVTKTASDLASELSNMGDTMLSGSSSKGISYSYVQNNYSPKALSSIEIYRQTKNQLSVIGRKGW